ncbi:MAG: GNAT family N-acetyltransferase [Pseudomonadota bacterium]
MDIKMAIEYRNEVPHIEDYWPLFLSTGWNEIFKMEKSDIERALANSSFVIAAYAADKLVGFARAVSDGVMYAAVYDVIVHPDFQKQGIGKRLVENITKLCKESGVFSVHLFAAEGTEPFYNKAGFKARPQTMPGMRYEG